MPKQSNFLLILFRGSKEFCFSITTDEEEKGTHINIQFLTLFHFPYCTFNIVVVVVVVLLLKMMTSFLLVQDVEDHDEH